MAERKQLSPKTRFDVFKRDGFACQYCGAHPPGAVLHVDHVLAVAQGGGNEITNLVTACSACNGGKGARLLSEVPESVAEISAEAAEREEQVRGYQKILDAKERRQKREATKVWKVFGEEFGLAKAHAPTLRSIKMFNERLGFHDTLDAMEYAISRKVGGYGATFKYFCGVCWGRIKKAAA